MQYNNYWAQHPPYVLSCLSIFCVTTMGVVDCLIFSLRERPGATSLPQIGLSGAASASGANRCLPQI